ncbi:hypothetical protein DB347_06470 [Opitutaceae bacterium EW11]|nr:hypothetical protein DB347_06470 [Opitutaceae bacterium EW11]
MFLTFLTVVHVIVSLVGIAAGLVVLRGLLIGESRDRWTAFFLGSTVLTSVTGFFFPTKHLMPSQIVGGVSLLILALAIYARYPRRLHGAWRKVYVIGAVLALYLNVFVGVVQAFMKTPALRALAPTQTELPFKATQLVVLALFAALGVAATIRSRTQTT